MKIQLYIVLFILISLTACQDSTSPGSDASTRADSLENRLAELEAQVQFMDSLQEGNLVGIANTEVRELTSEFNNQTYQIKVSFPKNYHKNTGKSYPVFYVIDAETNFGGVSYIVQRLIKDKLIPEILVVGIAYNTDYKNCYRLRSRDLTPVEDKELKMGNNEVDPTGGAPLFCDFLEFELFPFIESEYRVKNEDRGVYGHSYGGLFGSYVLLDRSHLFNKYLLLGPSLWYKDKLLVNQVSDKSLSFPNPTRVYMASGEFDLRINKYQEEFIQLLRVKNIPNLSMESEVMEKETHRTIFGVGFTNGLRYIYEDRTDTGD